jgi:hypothetical protein
VTALDPKAVIGRRPLRGTEAREPSTTCAMPFKIHCNGALIVVVRSFSVEFSQHLTLVIGAFADQIVDVAVLDMELHNIAAPTTNWKPLR